MSDAGNELVGILAKWDLTNQLLQRLAAGLTTWPGAYSQGSWVPTLLGDGTVGAPTYVTQVGSYEKLGRLVVARFNVAISAIGGMTGNLLLGGLPFSSNSTAGDIGTLALGDVTGLTLGAGFTQMTGDVQPSSLTARLIELGSGKTATQIPLTGVAAATVISGVATYRTN